MKAVLQWLFPSPSQLAMREPRKALQKELDKASMKLKTAERLQEESARDVALYRMVCSKFEKAIKAIDEAAK